MTETTCLRYIRLKCGITLMELEEHSSFSNQYLSLLELGRANCTPRNAETLDRAMLDIILSRPEELMKLARFCYEHKGHLLDIRKNDLLKRYGLCRSPVPARRFLYYVPLIILASGNLWNGVAINYTPMETVCRIVCMLCVGFLEEVIFRGLLFTAMAKDNVRSAIVISSVTFGIGHIINLFNGSGMDLVSTFIALYYFVYFKAQSIIQDLLANAAVYGAQIKSSAYSLYLFGSVGVGDGKAMWIVAAVVVALFGLTWVLLSRSFLHIATSSGKAVRRAYRETTSRQRSVDVALLNRELSHFTSSPSYMLNCGLGTFLMPVCAVAALWKGRSLFAMLDALFVDTAGSVPVLLCVIICGLASMNFMTAPSISLEGKSLWLMQSLPVNPWKLFQAKIRMQIILTGLPLLLGIVCTAIVYPLPLLWLLVIVLFAVSYTLLAALFGLTLGVKMPTLTWTNELMPIKQSAPVVITLFGGMGYTVLLFAGFLLLPGWTLGFAGYMACFIGVNVILCICDYLWLRKTGTARFAEL